MQMPQISRGRALAYLCAVLLMLALGGRFLLHAGDQGGPRAETSRPAAVEAEVAAPRTLVVHVVGAVRRPGLYELEEGSRVDDAIEQAGGPKPKAALDQVNLAAPVADGQQVVVPARSAAAPGAAGAAGASSGASPDGPVHLNTATLDELDSLPGVGPVTAQKILEYREAHGAFQSIEELDAVPGIGPTLLEELKEVVQL